MISDDLRKAFHGKVQGAVPADDLGLIASVRAAHGFQQASLQRHRTAGRQMQG